MAKQTYRYRLYPSKAQTTCLNSNLALCCELYNAALQERRDAYRLERKTIHYFDQCRQLPAIKAIREDIADIHSQVLVDTLRRVDKAFQNFFRRVQGRREKAGFPRFRSRYRYDSFTYPQTGFEIRNGKLRLSKIGEMRIKLHRPIEGKIKTLTITRSATGKWFACFSVDVEPGTTVPNCEPVGIDVGLTHFATLSTGGRIANPRFFRTEQDALAKAQRRFSVERKGTPERKARRRIVARVHERIKCRRNNFAHQQSRKLVDRFGMIFLEDLDIRNMVKNRCLAKSISDVAWNQLVQFTSYKAANAGRLCKQVDPRFTSQTCSTCGAVAKKILSERVHNCPCGLVLDRDHNAALNILALGLQGIGLQVKEAPRL